MAASGSHPSPATGSHTVDLDSAAVVSFVAPSGTGKTTLIAEVISGLTSLGIRVGAVKHDAHRIELDTEGKDSWRLRQAGAAETALLGANQMAWMSTDNGVPTLDIVLPLMLSRVDIVLVEGFRSGGLPTIVVERTEVAGGDWQPPSPESILARVHPSDVEVVIQLLLDTFNLKNSIP